MFDTTILPGTLVRHTAVDEVGLGDISRAHLTWFEDRRFEPQVPVLWDVRGQFLNLSLMDLAELHRYTTVNTKWRRSPGSRSALLVSYTVLQRVLEETVVNNTQFIASFRVFTEESEALAWLGVPDKQVS